MKSKVSDAIGLALNDLKVETVTSVPGYGGSAVLQSYNILGNKRFAISFHEEVAYTIAHGASILGKRCTSLMKAHGFIKAANSAVDSLYTSINAGFVTIIFDDKSGKHSDNILEIEPILKGMYFPYKVGKTASIYDDVIECFLESEQRGLPYALIVDADSMEQETDFEQKSLQQCTNKYERDIYKHVVHPLLSEYQYRVFTSKRSNGETNSFPKPQLQVVPGNISETIKETVAKYTQLFEVFKNVRGEIVTGDTSASSIFAFPPYNLIDIVTYIGGSIPLAMGAYLAGAKDVWAISGDFGFISAGYTGLIEAVERDLPIKIIILNNKKSAATGGQQIQKTLMMRLIAGYDKYVKHISDPQDPMEVNEVLKEAKAEFELRVIIADY